MNNQGVYLIKQLSSGKNYVGSSVNLKKRWQKHRRELIQQKHHNSKLQRTWLKYGEADFQFEVLEEVADRANLLVREQFWMEQLSAYGVKGFNLSPVAGRPQAKRGPHSEATKAKIREKRALQAVDRAGVEKTRAANLGKKRSDEARQRISAAKRGVPLSEAHRESIAAVRRGTTIPPEVRAKMAAAAKGKVRTAEHSANLSASLKRYYAQRREA